MWRYFTIAKTQLFLFGVLPLIVGIGLSVPFFKRYNLDRVLREQGIVTPGQILSSHKNEKGLLAVRYRFQDARGVIREANGVLSPAWEDTYKSFGEILVIYHPWDPSYSIPGDSAKNRPEETFNLTFLVVGLILTAAGLGVWIHKFATLARTAHLLWWGDLAIGQVNDWVGVMEGKDGMFTYYFVGNNGRWYQGHSQFLPVKMLEQWPSGTKLYVAFSPHDPTVNVPDIFHLRGVAA